MSGWKASWVSCCLFVAAAGCSPVAKPDPAPTRQVPVATIEARPAPARVEVEELAPSPTAEVESAPAAVAAPAAPSERREAEAGKDRALGDVMQFQRQRSVALSADVSNFALGRGAGGLAKPSAIGASAPLAMPVAPSPEMNTERYAHASDNAFAHTADAPLSTFSIDVDTASYANVRRFLTDGVRPPVDAVRIEELVNYFDYGYPEPAANEPFSVTTEVAAAPWNRANRLVRIGLKTRAIESQRAPASNLVFLIDVSGSMADEDKLPLLRRGLSMLANNLRAQDRVAIVVYAGSSGLVLPSTTGDKRSRILAALERLEAGGSTNGGAGIQLAYSVAQQHFIQGGVNRVILATDGDFNVGTTSQGELVRMIEDKRKSGVFLTVLGFGRGNLNDSGMEALADHGNGAYAYIDSIAEARKVLVQQAMSTLVTVAKDVKLQIEWNPKRVASYRLIGFENRVLAARDFNDDKKDAGEIGAGHTMTALYEVIPAAAPATKPEVDALRYQAERSPTAAAESDELLTIKLRYKRPSADQSELMARTVRDPAPGAEASADLRWAAAVACFGMLLRDSEHKGQSTLALANALARGALGSDPNGQRHEFVRLLDQARQLGVGATAATTPRAQLAH